MSNKQNEIFEEAKKEYETKCDKCGKMYTIEETYGANGSDEYSQMEYGHDFYCIYRNIDPNNRPYVKEVSKL